MKIKYYIGSFNDMGTMMPDSREIYSLTVALLKAKHNAEYCKGFVFYVFKGWPNSSCRNVVDSFFKDYE